MIFLRHLSYLLEIKFVYYSERKVLLSSVIELTVKHREQAGGQSGVSCMNASICSMQCPVLLEV
jgi:hypothetical protein